MRYARISCFILLLAGCSKAPQDDQAPVSNALELVKAEKSSDTTPTASVPAQPAPDCTTATPQSAPSGKPSDDIIGIREGISVEQVKALMNCSQTKYEFSSGVSELRQSNGDPSLRSFTLAADGGLDDVVAAFVGSPDQEKLIRVARSLEYAAGSEEMVEVVKASIEKKYGEFTSNNSYAISGAILYSPDSQKLGKANNDFGRCTSNIGSDLNSSFSIQNCGLAATYRIEPLSTDKDRVHKFTVVIMNQSHVLGAMKDAAQQRQSEIDNSLAKSKGPTL